MNYADALNRIIKTPSAIKLLRYMIVYETEQTGRETARQCGISYVQAHRILSGLVNQGVVIKRKAGNAYIFKINREHEAVKRLLTPMFSEEKGIAKKIINEKIKPAAKHAISVVLYGSVNRGEERPDSDVDLFFLVKSGKEKQLVKEIIPDISPDFVFSTGNRLDALVLTAAEYKKEKAGSKQVIKSIESGETIYGKPLSDALEE